MLSYENKAQSDDVEVTTQLSVSVLGIPTSNMK